MFTNQLFEVRQEFWFILFVDSHGVNTPIYGIQAGKMCHVLSAGAPTPVHDGWDVGQPHGNMDYSSPVALLQSCDMGLDTDHASILAVLKNL